MTITHAELKAMPLRDIADLMDINTLPAPETYYDLANHTTYPTFANALREVAQAEDDKAPFPRCVNCLKTGYYYPADKAYAPGHCYSMNGMREFTKISQCCEFCFDYMFPEVCPGSWDGAVGTSDPCLLCGEVYAAHDRKAESPAGVEAMATSEETKDPGDIDLQIIADQATLYTHTCWGEELFGQYTEDSYMDQATLYEKSLPAEELDAVYAGFTEEDYMAKAEHDREKYQDQADYTSTLDDEQTDFGGWEDH